MKKTLNIVLTHCNWNLPPIFEYKGGAYMAEVPAKNSRPCLNNSTFVVVVINGVG